MSELKAVLNKDSDHELKVLKDVFSKICDLTVNHHVIGGSAVVYPSDLGKVLA